MISVIRMKKRKAIHCPWHEEKTPSCIVELEQNSWGCLSCGAGGLYEIDESREFFILLNENDSTYRWVNAKDVEKK